jgi:hypothetical protein
MSLHKLIFDTTAADDGANVGAYLRSSDGTLLTHTTVSGDEALDVNLVQSVTLTVEATDLDIRDLTHVSDSVKVGDGTDFLEITASGEALVSATDFDIRDLTHVGDKDSVRIGDGTDLATITDIDASHKALDVNLAGSDIEIDVEDDLANTAIASSSESVSVTGALFTSDLADRRFIWMYNNGNKTVFIGPSGVSIANGFPIPAGSILSARIGAAVAVHAIAESGTQDVRTLQAS